MIINSLTNRNLTRRGRRLSPDKSPSTPPPPLSPLQFSMTTSWHTPTWSLRTSSLSTQTTPSYTTPRRSETTAGMKAGPRTKVRMLNKQGLMQAEQPGRLLCGRPFGCKFSTAEAVNHPHVFPLGTHIYPGQLWLVFAYLHMTVWDIFGETFMIIDIKIQFFF